jgi:dihydrofolate reductase
MALPPQRAHESPGARPDGDVLELEIIAAVAANGIIGADGGMPWRLPEDLKRFRALTTGHAVIMGRRTWESLGRALPDRQNLVVTRDRAFQAAGAEVAGSLEDALARVRLPSPAFCIGGAQLYAAALPRAARLHLTEIDRAFDGDTRFPAFDRTRFVEVARESHRQPGPDGVGYAYVTYGRR